MPLATDVVKIDQGKLPIADLDDFRALTGKSLEQYIDELQTGGRSQVAYLDDLLDPDMRALIWVRLRDDETRYRNWQSDDEMWNVMTADIRRLTTDDMQNMANAVATELPNRNIPQRPASVNVPPARRAEQVS